MGMLELDPLGWGGLSSKTCHFPTCATTPNFVTVGQTGWNNGG